MKQVSNPVRWQQTVEKLLEDGVDTFIEVGAGKTLSGLIRKTIPGAAIFNVEKPEDLLKLRRCAHERQDCPRHRRQPRHRPRHCSAIGPRRLLCCRVRVQTVGRT